MCSLSHPPNIYLIYNLRHNEESVRKITESDRVTKIVLKWDTLRQLVFNTKTCRGCSQYGKPRVFQCILLDFPPLIDGVSLFSILLETAGCDCKICPISRSILPSSVGPRGVTRLLPDGVSRNSVLNGLAKIFWRNYICAKIEQKQRALCVKINLHLLLLCLLPLQCFQLIINDNDSNRC